MAGLLTVGVLLPGPFLHAKSPSFVWPLHICDLTTNRPAYSDQQASFPRRDCLQPGWEIPNQTPNLTSYLRCSTTTGSGHGNVKAKEENHILKYHVTNRKPGILKNQPAEHFPSASHHGNPVCRCQEPAKESDALNILNEWKTGAIVAFFLHAPGF